MPNRSSGIITAWSVVMPGGNETETGISPAITPSPAQRVHSYGHTPPRPRQVDLTGRRAGQDQVGIALEACAFGAKAGLDPTVMLEVLNTSSGRSGATTTDPSLPLPGGAGRRRTTIVDP